MRGPPRPATGPRMATDLRERVSSAQRKNSRGGGEVTRGHSGC
ncbi:hypothetical protein RGE_20440 [Rubrivivax gelatinosus IL144]|uniref:Uncharacterized protein n=1 Tax=Rubrivivax gelatinosus (strain NBRC 100245 / IL144) TaxID=983917 RepID=I0HQU8_RUBGI|nr:hypothetical protein RGE_20440 [Rubrivivax gelatinosus IL144]